MAAMKTMLMNVISVGQSMGENIGNSSKLALAISIANSFMLQRMIASKTVEFGCIKYGGKPNSFASEILELRKPTLDYLQHMLEMKVSQGSGKLNDAMKLAHEVLINTNKNKKYNRVVLIITDGAEYDISDGVKNSLRADECIVYVLMICKQSELEDKQSHIDKLKEFANRIHGFFGIADDLSSGLKFLSGPGLGTRPIQSKIRFEISPTMSIPCVYWGKVMKSNLPTLKKQSNVSYDEDVPDSGKLSSMTVYRNPSNPDEELAFEDRVKGYKYGPQYIPMGGADMESMLKLKSLPVIRLLGFVSRNKVSRNHFLESTLILNGKTDSEGACVAISALATALRNKNQVAIVRFVKREDSDPWLAGLFPPDDVSSGGSSNEVHHLVIQRLPCVEDIRNFLFPSIVEANTLTLPQKQVIATAIDSCTINNITSISDILLYNPSLTSLLLKLQSKVISPLTEATENITSDESMGMDHFFRSPSDSGDSWKNVFDEFNLSVVEKSSSKKRKVYWSDINIVSEQKDGEESKDASGSKSQGSNAMDISYLTVTVPPPLGVGSVTPTDDFIKILSEATNILQLGQNTTNVSPHDLISAMNVIKESVSVLCKIIELLVTTGGTGAHYRKALVSLKALREGCLTLGSNEVKTFNNYLQTNIKAAFSSSRFVAFWKDVVKDKVTLISQEEFASASSIRIQSNLILASNDISFPSSKEAVQFLEEVVEVVSQPIATISAQVDDDDLFENMD